jgi:hypothetical protein
MLFYPRMGISRNDGDLIYSRDAVIPLAELNAAVAPDLL